MDECIEPHLGLATTEELIKELDSRFKISLLTETNSATLNALHRYRAKLLTMLSSIHTRHLMSYRTVDS